MHTDILVRHHTFVPLSPYSTLLCITCLSEIAYSLQKVFGPQFSNDKIELQAQEKEAIYIFDKNIICQQNLLSFDNRRSLIDAP